MVVGAGADGGGRGEELAAAGGDGVVQGGEVGMVAVRQPFIEQGPEALGGPELGV